MNFKSLVAQLANRINQPHMIEICIRKVFASGVEWQSKQSPWISVKDRLPDNDYDLYFVLDTKLVPPACGVCEFNLAINKWFSAGGIIVHPTHWMKIPPLQFDKILEANKEVLQRIKEKENES